MATIAVLLVHGPVPSPLPLFVQMETARTTYEKIVIKKIRVDEIGICPRGRRHTQREPASRRERKERVGRSDVVPF